MNDFNKSSGKCRVWKAYLKLKPDLMTFPYNSKSEIRS